MPANRICVCIQPRIHIGLISMHDTAPRLNGGVGFAIDKPTARIDVTEASNLSVHDDRRIPMTPGELRQLSEALERFALRHGLEGRAEIRISGSMLTHVGMGSSTAIRLGATEALAVLNGFPAARDVLVTGSERGGTSGIGINSYFAGGLICDLGRPNEGNSFVPSSQARTARSPLALPSVSMPNWPLVLCIPRSIPPKTQQEEIAFFERTTPLPPTTSFEASYVALFDVYASAAEADYSAFCRGITRMQQTAWKQAERQQYGSALQTLSATLLETGADCVGMSSLGPMLYCFVQSTKLMAIVDAARTMDCEVHQTAPANHGRRLTSSNA